MPKQFLESFARNHNGIERAGCPKSRIARLLREECSFSEDLAISQSSETSAIALNRGFAFDDKVHFVPGVTIAEDRLAFFKMFPVHIFFVKEPQLGDVPWEESIENPIDHESKLTIQSWELRDIDATPQHPG
jgi:hypothetical protein